MFGLTLKWPRVCAMFIMSHAPSIQTTALLSVLVSVMAAIISYLGVLLIGGDSLLAGGQPPPLLIASIHLLVLYCFAGATYKIGALFGGEGRIWHAVLLMVWLEAIMLVFHILQIILIFVLPVLGAILPFLSVVLFFYLFVNFVVALHHFRSGGKVFLATLVSFVGAIYGIALMVSFVASLSP